MYDTLSRALSPLFLSLCLDLSLSAAPFPSLSLSLSLSLMQGASVDFAGKWNGAVWEHRYQHSVVSWKNSIWVVAGGTIYDDARGTQETLHNDLWKSVDFPGKIKWECVGRCCNTLQHTVAPHNILWHTAAHCSILQHTAAHCSTLQHIATRCNTPQHTAMHRNTLQHTATC